MSCPWFPTPKIDELAYVIDNRRPDLVFITETWLKPNIPDAVINIDNYILLRLDRTEKEHGGVCINVKENYIVDYLEMQMKMALRSFGLLLTHVAYREVSPGSL